MNLVFHLQKKFRHLIVTGKVEIEQIQRDGDVWVGFRIYPDDLPQLRVKNATSLYPLRERPENLGWQLTADEPETPFSISFVDTKTEVVCGQRTMLANPDELKPVRLPWDISSAPPARGADLVIHVPQDSPGPVFLGIFRQLDKRKIVSICKGKGVEIGPGPNPRVRPSPKVEVYYIEQKPADEWQRLYGGAKTPTEFTELFKTYRVGDAHQIPFPDESLDFVFSSHVFEHLANPLGHLEIWSRKLRKGGKVACIVPDLTGANDFGSEQSTLEELITEYEIGDFKPNMQHYERWARTHRRLEQLDNLWADQYSIHVHYYTSSNMAHVLHYAVKNFGFKKFSIVQSPSHKDFQFVIWK